MKIAIAVLIVCLGGVCVQEKKLVDVPTHIWAVQCTDSTIEYVNEFRLDIEQEKELCYEVELPENI